MTDERAERVAELFERALGMPDEQRASFLDQQCGSDQGLRDRVETLLRHDDAAETRFLAGRTDSPLSLEGPGTSIGPYQLRTRLGEGGFGEVYLAEQSGPVRRQVALKLVKPGMDTRQVIARFEAERQALAVMDHPHVAKVFDAGATERGRPYFVMEYVPGVAITEYCDTERLGTNERLHLMIQVCDAVQHAHQKAIIHRDLKPSNILVELVDGHPIPKIIDFGVAKATGPSLTEQTLLTETGAFIGTPGYMSPEQAELSVVGVDSRTDIYALGVVLYELLTGLPLFDPDTFHGRGLDEIRRIIREVEPPTPSTRLSALGRATEPRSHEATNGSAGVPPADVAAGPRAGRSSVGSSGLEIAGRRRSDPRSLTRQLRGDLDWITMKAMEKDRARRYASASELAADLRRHLSHEPVLAGPPSKFYRLSKFVRRNRAGVAAAGLVALVLLAATGVSIGFAASEAEQRRLAVAAEQEQSRAREEAEEARAHEEREREKAEAINEFVTKALVSSDPHLGGAQGFLVTDAMEQAIELLDSGDLNDQPEIEAGLTLTISGILNGNARSEDALRLAQRALEINQELHAGDHADVARSLNGVAKCLESLGRLAEALSKHEAALEMNQRLFPGDHPDVAKSLNDLANCLDSLGRRGEALPKFEAALEMYQRLFSDDHPDVARSLNNVAICRHNLGQPAEALPKLEAALEMFQRLHEGDHPSVATALSNVATCLRSLGRSAEALPKFEAALAIGQRLFDGDHPDVVQGLHRVAGCLGSLGRHREALPRYVAALEMVQRLYPGDHPDVAQSLNNLAFCLDHLGRRTEALPNHIAALEMIQRLYEGDHPNIVTSLNNVAYCLRTLSRPAEALPYVEAALEMSQRLYDGDHEDVATSLNNVATCLRPLGRSEEALPKHEAALEMFQRLYPNDHPYVAHCLSNVAACLRTVGRLEDALPKYEAALEMDRRVLPPGHPNTLHPQIGLAATFTMLGRYEEAEQLLSDAAEQCEQSEASRHMHWRAVIDESIRLYEAWDKPEQAAEWQAELQSMAPAESGEATVKTP